VLATCFWCETCEFERDEILTAVSIIALLISIGAIGFSWSRSTITKLTICTILLFVHIGASLYYYLYSQASAADSSMYYFDPYGFANGPWGLSTQFVMKLCQLLKVQFGASYLDCFLLFQSIGFAGMMIMARVFDEIEANVGVSERRGYWVLLFLPSVSFWTSAIGKDAPVFFAISLCVWAALSLRARFLYFGISLAVLTIFRAHIAFMAAIAFAVAVFFGSSISFGRKAGILAVALVGIFVTSGAVENSLGVDPTSLSSVTSFLDDQNNVFSTIAGTSSLGNASYAARVVGLLFRPFFIDAHGMLGIVASIENVGVVIAMLYVIGHRRDFMLLFRRVPFFRFVSIFAFIVLFSLTLVYYNIGLGLRERVMAYPMIFSILVALWSLRRKHKLEAAPQWPGRLMVASGTNSAVAEV
jgi:hypothetical protein